jgi:hypothetical protein
MVVASGVSLLDLNGNREVISTTSFQVITLQEVVLTLG